MSRSELRRAGKAMYPKRCPLFMVKYIRFLIQSGAVHELGTDSFALLVSIVEQEDALRYAYAPNFFNEQLMRLCGIATEPTFCKARTRAQSAGFLQYFPGAKRRPGVYFVDGFPQDFLVNRKLSETIGNYAEGIGGNEQQTFCPPILSPNPVSIPVTLPINLSERWRKLREDEEFCRDVVELANKLTAVKGRNRIFQMELEEIWQVAWIGLDFDRAVVEDCYQAILERRAKKPNAYLRKAMVNLCESRNTSWNLARMEVPEPPPRNAKDDRFRA